MNAARIVLSLTVMVGCAWNGDWTAAFLWLGLAVTWRAE